MALGTKIEWSDHTWTLVAGCDPVSPGCANCYAAPLAARLQSMGMAKYRGLATRIGNRGKWTGKVTLSEAELLAPTRVRKPGRWFLSSMGDIYHDAVPRAFVDRAFAVMASEGCQHHTFLVLTKRAQAGAEYLLDPETKRRVWRAMREMVDPTGSVDVDEDAAVADMVWPPTNIMIGATAEDQPRADERRPLMAAIAAAGWRTFVSYEPALGPVNWAGWQFLASLISGGESGPGARPAAPRWFRIARDFCAAHAIDYLHKQNGAWIEEAPPSFSADASGRYRRVDGTWMRRVGKRRAGRLLDGVEHNGSSPARVEIRAA